MDRRLAHYLIGMMVALVVVGVSAFYIGNRIARPGLAASKGVKAEIVAGEIVAEAKKRVPEPPALPRPAGQQVPVTEVQQVQVEVPVTQCRQVKFAFGASVCVPEIQMQSQTVSHTVTTLKYVDPNPAAVRQWQLAEEKRHAQYQAKFNGEIAAVAAERAQKEKVQDSLLSTTERIIRDTIIPFITALTGLISALVLLYRGYAPAPRAPDRS